MSTTDTQQPQLYSDVYKKLIREKCPEVLDDPQLQVFASIITSLAERHEQLAFSHLRLRKTVNRMAGILKEMAEGGEGNALIDETIEGEPGMTGAGTGTVGGAGGVVGGGGPARREQDQTPFPAGVSATVAGAAATAAAKPADASPTSVDAAERAADDLTPNVGGAGAVNPQPIPNGASAGPPNQSRVVNVRKNGPATSA